jgi:CelD/BcsL family acetyltransferase involved in cellulose biosynthesis
MMAGDTAMPGLLVRAFREAGLQAELKETARAPYLELPTSWAEYVKKLPRSHRRQVVRSLAAFAGWAAGEGVLFRARTTAELDEGKKILEELHHERWRACGEAGVFRRAAWVSVHASMMSQLLDRGGLELLWLSVRGAPVAALYAMSWGGKVYAYQMGRSTAVPRGIRPGGVLLALAVREAIEAGRREFDFLADEAPYKLQMASRSRPLVRVRAFRPGLLEALRRLGRRVRDRLAPSRG